mgnify:CR=1 FL=1
MSFVIEQAFCFFVFGLPATHLLPALWPAVSLLSENVTFAPPFSENVTLPPPLVTTAGPVARALNFTGVTLRSLMSGATSCTCAPAAAGSAATRPSALRTMRMRRRASMRPDGSEPDPGMRKYPPGDGDVVAVLAGAPRA